MRTLHVVLLSIALMGAGGCTSDNVVAERSSATTTTAAAPTDAPTSAPRPSADRRGSTPKTDEPTVPPSSIPVAHGELQTIRVFLIPDPRREVRGAALPCSEVVPVKREIRETRAVAAAALTELFKGPTAEEEGRGLASFFGPDTADLLRSVRIEDGVAYVDLEDIVGINNVSTSCASTAFLAQMDATLKQFPTIKETVYATEGSAESFYYFLYGGCPSRLEDTEGDCAPGRF